MPRLGAGSGCCGPAAEECREPRAGAMCSAEDLALWEGPGAPGAPGAPCSEAGRGRSSPWAVSGHTGQHRTHQGSVLVPPSAGASILAAEPGPSPAADVTCAALGTLGPH